MSRIIMVAAVARDAAIGRDNALLWHLPEDLARFKALTLGKPAALVRASRRASIKASRGQAGKCRSASGKLASTSVSAS